MSACDMYRVYNTRLHRYEQDWPRGFHWYIAMDGTLKKISWEVEAVEDQGTPEDCIVEKCLGMRDRKDKWVYVGDRLIIDTSTYNHVRNHTYRVIYLKEFNVPRLLLEGTDSGLHLAPVTVLLADRAEVIGTIHDKEMQNG